MISPNRDNFRQFIIFKYKGRPVKEWGSRKDKLNHLSSKSVYKILFSSGAIYIGEAGCLIHVRVLGRKRCLLTGGLLSNSPVTEHHPKPGLEILFDSTSIVTKSPYYFTRKILETIEIISHPNTYFQLCEKGPLRLIRAISYSSKWQFLSLMPASGTFECLQSV